MNLEELKNKHAELYEQIKESGRTEILQGKNMDQIRAEAESEGREEILKAVKIAMGKDARQKIEKALEAGLNPEQARFARDMFGNQGGNFESLVNQYQEKHGCQRSKAMAAIAAENPEVHRAWLQEQQNEANDKILDGLRSASRARAPEVNTFESLVDEYQKTNNCKRSEAIGVVAEENPDLHKAWIDGQQR